jgi:hypothetical protein
MDQASAQKLLVDDGLLSFRYEGRYESNSEDVWNDPSRNKIRSQEINKQ